MASTLAHEQQDRRAERPAPTGQDQRQAPEEWPQPPGPYATHDVTNQPPPLSPYDASEDAALLEGLRREGAGWAERDVRRLGALAGSAEAQEWAEQANRHEPELRTHDRYGNRIDEVDFHPSWHHLMRTAVAEGLAGAPWAHAEQQRGTHVQEERRSPARSRRQCAARQGSGRGRHRDGARPDRQRHRE
ncbi:hypothetical protein ABZ651_33080, partial [Streptomyces sp. NPDC007070]